MPTESTLHALNLAEPAQAERELLACCASQRWARELIARRPYPDVATVTHISDVVFAQLTWADLEQAVAAHPRIGERATGLDRAARWSRDEQSNAASDVEHLRSELAAATAEYERRHGRVFLICASGRSAAEILGAVRARMDNDETTERTVVRDELRKITNLRLRKLMESA